MNYKYRRQQYLNRILFKTKLNRDKFLQSDNKKHKLNHNIHRKKKLNLRE